MIYYDRDDLPYVDEHGELLRVSDCCDALVTLLPNGRPVCQHCGGVLAPEYATEPATDTDTHRTLMRLVEMETHR